LPKGLHQVGQDGVLEQESHGAGRLQVGCRHRLPVPGEPDDDPADSRLQVGQIAGQGENRHDLASGHNDEPLFPDRTRVDAAQADHHRAEGPVVHIHGPRPGDPPRVETQRIPLMQVVVQHGREQVVRRGDGVKITGEVQVDLVHGDHLRVSTAGRAAFDPEHRAQAWLPNADDHLLAQPPQCLADADRDGALPLSRRCRIDPGDQNQAALGFSPGDRLGGDLGLVPTIRQDFVRTESHFGGDLGDGSELGRLGDGDVGGDRSQGSAHTQLGVRSQERTG
jgi:hypothetical protein